MIEKISVLTIKALYSKYNSVKMMLVRSQLRIITVTNGSYRHRMYSQIMDNWLKHNQTRRLWAASAWHEIWEHIP